MKISRVVLPLAALGLMLVALQTAAKQEPQVPPAPAELRIEGPPSFARNAKPFVALLINTSAKAVAFVEPNQNPRFNVWARWQVRDAQGYALQPKPDQIVFCSGTTMYQQDYHWADGPDQLPVLGEQIQLKDEDVVLLEPGQRAALPIIAPDVRYDLTARGTYSITLRYELYASLYALPADSAKAAPLTNTPSLVLVSNTLTVAQK